VAVWYPSLEARTLITALHAARDAHSSKTMEDLRRTMASIRPARVQALAELAERLNAQAALRAGLETLPETSDWVEPLGLAGVEVPTYWALQSRGADPLTIELARVRTLPPGKQLRQVGRWLVPSSASMRARHPEASDSRTRLVGGYLRRWGSGLRRLPGAVSKIRRARRGAGES